MPLLSWRTFHSGESAMRPNHVGKTAAALLVGLGLGVGARDLIGRAMADATPTPAGPRMEYQVVLPEGNPATAENLEKLLNQFAKAGFRYAGNHGDNVIFERQRLPKAPPRATAPPSSKPPGVAPGDDIRVD
jgi:hypothetical protein